MKLIWEEFNFCKDKMNKFKYNFDDMKDATDFLNKNEINYWSTFTSSAKILELANKLHKEKYPEEWTWGFFHGNVKY